MLKKLVWVGGLMLVVAGLAGGQSSQGERAASSSNRLVGLEIQTPDGDSVRGVASVGNLFVVRNARSGKAFGFSPTPRGEGATVQIYELTRDDNGRGKGNRRLLEELEVRGGDGTATRKIGGPYTIKLVDVETLQKAMKTCLPSSRVGGDSSPEVSCCIDCGSTSACGCSASAGCGSCCIGSCCGTS